MMNVAEVEQQVLSDESMAYNVIAKIDNHTVRFACYSGGHAIELAKNLNACSYVELV